MNLGVVGVHPEEIPREECGLVAAGSGANLENGALFIRCIPGQQHQLQMPRGLVDARTGSAALFLREITHLAIRGRVGKKGLDTLEFGPGGPIIVDRGDDRSEFGQLTRQRDEGLGIRSCGEGGRQNRMAIDDGVETVLRKDDAHETDLYAPATMRHRARYRPS